MVVGLEHQVVRNMMMLDAQRKSIQIGDGFLTNAIASLDMGRQNYIASNMPRGCDEKQTIPMLEVQCDMAISRDEASAMSTVQITILEQTAQEDRSSLGNHKLRCMSTMEVRRLLRKELIGDPATMARWQAYDEEWQARERTYAAAQFRAFERGERGGRI